MIIVDFRVEVLYYVNLGIYELFSNELNRDEVTEWKTIHPLNELSFPEEFTGFYYTVFFVLYTFHLIN